MNPELLRQCEAAMEKDIAEMTDEEKEHFIKLLPLITSCYRKGGKMRGVLLLSDETQGAMVTINCDNFEAMGVIHTVAPIMQERTMQNMPTPEFMN
jgi:hypothetical protein